MGYKLGTKEHKKWYYRTKVKPFRKQKQPHWYHSAKCPVCSKRFFMRNLKYNIDFCVDIVGFCGYSGITWKKGTFNPASKDIFLKLVKERIISLVHYFGITAEELGFHRIGSLRAESNLKLNSDWRNSSNLRSFSAIRNKSTTKIGSGLRI